jgi:hypothetical protein
MFFIQPSFFFFSREREREREVDCHRLKEMKMLHKDFQQPTKKIKIKKFESLEMLIITIIMRNITLLSRFHLIELMGSTHQILIFFFF